MEVTKWDGFDRKKLDEEIAEAEDTYERLNYQIETVKTMLNLLYSARQKHDQFLMKSL